MKILMLLKKVSVHGRDFVTPSTVIIVKKIKSCRNKKCSFGLPTAYQGKIFNMVLLPKERK